MQLSIFSPQEGQSIMRLLTGIVAAGLIAGMATAATAQTDGWYVGADTGVNLVPTAKFKTSLGSVKESHDPGFVLMGDVGYGFGPFRLEGELGWRTNGVDKLGGVNGSGSLELFSAMANAYYDIRTGTAFTPYIGAGIGVGDVDAGKLRNSSYTLSKDDDATFAYQGIAGVSYAVDQNVSLKLDYHYLRTSTASLNEDLSFNPHPGKARLDYESHAVMVGFIYRFGAPPAPVAAPAPAPVAAPAPAPRPVQAAPIARNFMVFFDFDRSDITSDAAKIIAQAAAYAKSNNAASITCIGHTDTVGSVMYNQALSLRRANAVKAALVKQGIPAGEISVVGKGKSDLLVPTADGVREPQNRRVQIILP
jgi:outer membrane protein OmpA-like peptidoglycan-associated protein